MYYQTNRSVIFDLNTPQTTKTSFVKSKNIITSVVKSTSIKLSLRHDQSRFETNINHNIDLNKQLNIEFH